MAYKDIKLCRMIDELNADIIDFHRDILVETMRLTITDLVNYININLYSYLRDRLRPAHRVFISDEEFEKMLP